MAIHPDISLKLQPFSISPAINIFENAGLLFLEISQEFWEIDCLYIDEEADFKKALQRFEKEKRLYAAAERKA